jgi:recombinational DNA repair ATPase RecF
MLDSLYIRNFRIFKELEIERLARVNLIVGRNNSGKSCLLEAVNLFAQDASPRVLYELIRKRGQDWEIEMRDKDQPVQESENPLRHIFHGYRIRQRGITPGGSCKTGGSLMKKLNQFEVPAV